MRILRPLRSATSLISLRNQPPICAPVLPIRQIVGVELLAELVDQLLPAAVIEPGVLLARVEAERRRAEQRPGRILADVVVERGVAHLDRAVLHRVERLQRRHDLAGGKDLDLELVVGRLRDVFGERLASAVQRVERLRPARGQSPFEFRRSIARWPARRPRMRRAQGRPISGIVDASWRFPLG